MFTPPDPAPALTVSELNHGAKTLLESHFDFVRVEGEIGDFTAAGSGHWYFTLKDAHAQVRCAMFRGANSRVKMRPCKGDHVRIRARVSLYEARGEFQLIAQHLEPAGDGALQLAFERLKAKLQAEGLFDLERKQPVPTAARRVGVITSGSGAALHDIIAVLARRSPMTSVFLVPVPVQGRESPPAIVEAIAQANRLHSQGTLPLDVLIVGRGGGSLEDLWAFNDEIVARAIAASDLPTVSAVGHEVDFSIADFTADQRAATPSAAAELISIDQAEWLQRVDAGQIALHQALTRRINRERQHLAHWRARLRHPGERLVNQREEVTKIRRDLHRAVGQTLARDRRHLDALSVRWRNRSPNILLDRAKGMLLEQERRLSQAMQQRLRQARHELNQNKRLLTSLGPENTLARGYAIVQAPDQSIVRSAGQVEGGAKLHIRLAQGSLGATVTHRELPKQES